MTHEEEIWALNYSIKRKTWHLERLEAENARLTAVADAAEAVVALFTADIVPHSVEDHLHATLYDLPEFRCALDALARAVRS
jgi:hypothetical protein